MSVRRKQLERRRQRVASSMSQASISQLKGMNSILKNPGDNNNAHRNFLNSVVRFSSNPHADKSLSNMSGSRNMLNVSQPVSPVHQGIIGQEARDRLNSSMIVRSSASMMSSTSSQEFVNIRARPIIINDTKPKFDPDKLQYEVKRTFYKKNRTATMKGKTGKSWLDVEAKNRSFAPPPGHYDIKEAKSDKMGFLKSKRVTQIQEYIKLNKWKLAPGVHYKSNSFKSTLMGNRNGIMHSKVQRMGYIDEAVVRGQQSPASIYKKDSRHTKKRQLYGNFSKGAKRESEFKIKKAKSGPDDYNYAEAFNKTQGKSRHCFFSKEKQPVKAGSSKFSVPGVGSYLKAESGFERLSPKPLSIRKRRC
ncbi:unnamed protein product [Moneuplotes crassus]|uniref:Uncharacterized protein n=1 Tax=Euplotes crassus TaxID=5936 RepID=A0AAD2CVK0_EUPCR|nr:unnamed protein product [Moneuplotes crassus]